MENAKGSGVTGIFKRSSHGPVEVTADGLAGDTKNHGGPDQAVYVFGAPDYAWWSEVLGRELPPGTFGENLTVSGFQNAKAHIGDCLYVGAEVVLEVTAPRIPCVTLAVRTRDPAFSKHFRRAERPGAYCRVLDGGRVETGDTVASRRYRGEGATAIEVFRDFFDPDRSEGAIRRHLAAPIAVRDRVEKEKQLEEAVARRSGARIED